ncbi:MAG: RNA methyltransferase [Dehalococcoidales bacterium]|nr:RNA methyltransferase [Dehalococcoidales bacterium]
MTYKSEDTSLKPIKWYKSLAGKKERLEAGVFLVEGERAVRQIAENNPNDIVEILSTGEAPSFCRTYVYRRITGEQLRSITSATTPQGIIAVVRIPHDVYSANLPDNPGSKILLLEYIQDPGNAGSLIRTAVAFGFSGVIMSEKCADPLSPKTVQSTAGTILSLWIRRTGDYLNLVRSLKAKGYSLVATDLDGEEAPSYLKEADKLLLALGNEAAGLSCDILGLADFRLKIPIKDKAESLNVAACGAICMYISF